MPAGRPKAFKDGEQLIDLFRVYCEEIAENGFTSVPTQTNFSKWLKKNFSGVDRRTIYNSLKKYFPDKKKDFEQIQGDTIAEGAMLGHYQSVMSIFALKNWCKWSDKPDNISNEVEKTDDGFIEALSDTASTDWADEQNEGKDDETANSSV